MTPIAITLLLLTALQDPTGNSSGGVLHADQACYDVEHYRLALRVDPSEKRIDGLLTMKATVLAESASVALDLDPALVVQGVTSAERELAWTHADGRIVVEDSELCASVGESFVVSVAYGGIPREAPRPPWEGGFTWETTASGAPWIATSCQGEGADVWWPCKDHPSDKPESMDLHITVPEGLVCATNGRENTDARVTTTDGWTTSHWRVSTPIANYTVALNIAPYVLLETELKSVAGDTFPVKFWVLPEDREKGETFLPEIVEHLEFFESTCGPYPFRADKYGVVQTPHLGMDHQTIIAYGNDFKRDKLADYDWLHHHELSHEWWANLVTARDWKDFWIHESIGTYTQALYLERKFGFEVALAKLRADSKRILDRGPIAPREARSTDQMYFAQEGSSAPGIDIYMKGARVLHSLRWLVGDEAFFRILRRWAYPDPALEATSDGSAVRFADTEELIAIAERESGLELDWFFEVYLRRAARPKLEVERDGVDLVLRWSAPDDLPFPMPVPLQSGPDRFRVEMPGGTARLRGGARSLEVDPDDWLLRR